MAAATGYTNSAVVTAAYTINGVYQVDLSWYAPTGSTDLVAGYNIYRTTGSGSSYQLLNSSIDTQTTYLDSTVQSGTAYTYYVESVDASGTQSVPSSPTSATIP